MPNLNNMISSDEITLEIIIEACYKEKHKRKDAFTLEELAQVKVLDWIVQLLELLKYKQDRS